MSRVLEFSDGAERGDTSWWTSANLTATQAQVAHGVYSYSVAGSQLGYKTISAMSELYFRCYVHIATATVGTWPIYFVDSVTDTIMLTLAYSPTSARWNITGGATGNTGNNSQLMDVWKCLEVYFKISDTVGVVTVRLDGVQVFTFTGDTKTGAITTIDKIQFGASATITAYIDDFAIDTSAWCGLGYYIALTPNAAGDVTQWTPTGAANYQNVSIPADDATYNTGATGQLDNYNMTTTTLGLATVERVIPFVRASNPSGGTLNVGLKTGGTNYTASVTTPSSLTWLVGAEYAVSPKTSLEWTQTDINNIQFTAEMP